MKTKDSKNDHFSKIENYNIDFVAIAPKLNRVCVCGHSDNFRAHKINEIWYNEYPEFDDLMDNFIEVKNITEITKYSIESRNALNFPISVKQTKISIITRLISYIRSLFFKTSS